ncbi:MAG: transposase [Nitriliruptorales bacterium]
MENRTELSRGDVRRNDRRQRLREVVSRARAICGIDLADEVQELVVTDHDGAVLARRGLSRTRAWQLGPALGWARQQSQSAGFDDVVVACEPTGHRWRVVAEQCDELGLDLVCVQPLLVHREREREDYTRDRSDRRDAVLIADLTSQLRCYIPERTDQTYARLRHLGARRQELVTRTGGCRQQLGALAECAWPAVLEAAATPLDSTTWQAALQVVLDRVEDGDLAGLRGRMRWSRFQAAVRRAVADLDGHRVCWRIARKVYDALGDDTGVPSQRVGVLERLTLICADWHHTRRLIVDVEARMVAVLDDLELTDLVTSIDGLSAVGAATILAETGDLTRYGSARAVVKHAGLCPRDNRSGKFAGTTSISGRGRPALRLAAWRAVWGALPNNVVLAARHEHLTNRKHNRLTGNQARAAVAGSLLRQLHAVVTRREPWNPEIAAGRHAAKEVLPAAA